MGGCDDAARSIFNGKIRYTDLLQNEAFLIRNASLDGSGRGLRIFKEYRYGAL